MAVMFKPSIFFISAVIGPSSGGKKGSGGVGTGKQTLRLRSKGPATVEVVCICVTHVV